MKSQLSSMMTTKVIVAQCDQPLVTANILLMLLHDTENLQVTSLILFTPDSVHTHLQAIINHFAANLTQSFLGHQQITSLEHLSSYVSSFSDCKTILYCANPAVPRTAQLVKQLHPNSIVTVGESIGISPIPYNTNIFLRNALVFSRHRNISKAYNVGDFGVRTAHLRRLASFFLSHHYSDPLTFSSNVTSEIIILLPFIKKQNQLFLISLSGNILKNLKKKARRLISLSSNILKNLKKKASRPFIHNTNINLFGYVCSKSNLFGFIGSKLRLYSSFPVSRHPALVTFRHQVILLKVYLTDYTALLISYLLDLPSLPNAHASPNTRKSRPYSADDFLGTSNLPLYAKSLQSIVKTDLSILPNDMPVVITIKPHPKNYRNIAAIEAFIKQTLGTVVFASGHEVIYKTHVNEPIELYLNKIISRQRAVILGCSTSLLLPKICSSLSPNLLVRLLVPSSKTAFLSGILSLKSPLVELRRSNHLLQLLKLLDTYV